MVFFIFLFGTYNLMHFEIVLYTKFKNILFFFFEDFSKLFICWYLFAFCAILHFLHSFIFVGTFSSSFGTCILKNFEHFVLESTKFANIFLFFCLFLITISLMVLFHIFLYFFTLLIQFSFLFNSNVFHTKFTNIFPFFVYF